MELSRRQLLVAGGIAGAGTFGTGYWQRRRLVRFSTIRELREIIAIDVPQIAADSIITMPLLESAHGRATDRFNDIEARIDPSSDHPSDAIVTNLQEQLTETAPERVAVWPHGTPAIHYARRQALFTYRRIRSRIISVLANVAPEELPSDAFDEQMTDAREQRTSMTVPYQGRTLGEATVASSLIESTLSNADGHLENAEEEDESTEQWGNLERATAAIEDGAAFIDVRDGTNLNAALSTLAERLVTEYEQRIENAPDPLIEGVTHEEGPVSSFANSAVGALQRSMRDLGAAHYFRRGLLDDGAYGRAAHIHALLLPTVPLYETFAEVPRVPYWEELAYDRGATPTELGAEKAATIDTLEPYLASNDPLVTHLAAVPLGVVRRTDNRLQTLIDDARTLTDPEWRRRRDQALLQYEGAHQYAESIEDTLEIIREVER
ncbi:hypothetical protein JCM18237_28110 [Halorubrum luteum]